MGQVVYLPGDNTKPLEEQRNMTISVPNYNMTIPTETRVEEQPMFWCPSTSMFVGDCFHDCKDNRDVSGTECIATANEKIYGCMDPDATNYDPEATNYLEGEDCANFMANPEKCWSCTYKATTAVLTNMTEYKVGLGLNVSHEDMHDDTYAQMYEQ